MSVGVWAPPRPGIALVCFVSAWLSLAEDSPGDWSAAQRWGSFATGTYCPHPPARRSPAQRPEGANRAHRLSFYKFM